MNNDQPVDSGFLEIQGAALRTAAMERDYEQATRVVKHMLAEGLTVDQVKEAADGLPLNAQQYLREQRGKLVRSTFVAWARAATGSSTVSETKYPASQPGNPR